MVNNSIIINKPKKKFIGIIPVNNTLLSNNDSYLNITKIFLKKNRYFLTFERDKDTKETEQIYNYFNTNYSLKIDEKSISYYGLRGNVMVYIINFTDINHLQNGLSSDISKYADYSWKTYFNINFEKNENDIQHNLHLNNNLISEDKKQKITIRELYQNIFEIFSI